MSKKIVWRVQPVPTGMHRSFHRRGWPQAYYGKDGPLLAMLSCAEDYAARRVATDSNDHGPLTISVCHHQHPDTPRSWKVFTLKRTAATLEEAKRRVESFYEAKPDWLPKEK